MQHENIHINSRHYTTAPNQVDVNTKNNILIDLSYLCVMDVVGEKAADFLQGQLTCDTKEVNAYQIRQGAMCDLKGRVLALMDLVQYDGMHCVLADDLYDKTETSLHKTALLSRVQLRKNTAMRVFGFILNNQQDILPGEIPEALYHVVQNDQYCCYRISTKRFILLLKTQSAIDSLVHLFSSKNQFLGSLFWHQLQLREHDFEIYPRSRGLFLPHRLGLHTHRISFNKGCYKGQEIIARTHYRAKQKHGMFTYIICTGEPLHSGQRILDHETGGEIGELVDYCPLEHHQYLIAASMLLHHPKIGMIDGHQNLVEFMTP